MFANPGDTLVEFLGGPTGPQDRFGFRISDPDGIQEIITIEITFTPECITSTVLSITDLGFSNSLPRDFTTNFSNHTI